MSRSGNNYSFKTRVNFSKITIISSAQISGCTGVRPHPPPPPPISPSGWPSPSYEHHMNPDFRCTVNIYLGCFLHCNVMCLYTNSKYALKSKHTLDHYTLQSSGQVQPAHPLHLGQILALIYSIHWFIHTVGHDFLTAVNGGRLAQSCPRVGWTRGSGRVSTSNLLVFYWLFLGNGTWIDLNLNWNTTFGLIDFHRYWIYNNYLINK